MKDIESIFNQVVNDIAEKGMSLKDAVKGKISRTRFYELLQDKNKADIYARACEERAEMLFDEIFNIADSEDGDVNRDRLRIDARKWALSKMNPKKYGDKIDVAHSGNTVIYLDKAFEGL